MDSEAATCANRPEVPFAPFLTGLALWALMRLILEAFVKAVNPEFFEDLKLDIRKKYDLYFGMCLGTMVKVVAMTSCTLSVFTTSADADIIGFSRPLNTAEQWCWGTRAIIYIQELPHVASIPELIIHHLLGVAGMIAIMVFNIPRRQLYLMWGTLVSEFVGNSRLFLKFHGKLTPRMFWWFSLAMVVTIVGFRVTGCLVALTWVLRGGTSGVALFVNVGAITIYLCYMFMMTWRELDRAKIVAIDKSHSTQLIIADKWRVNLYGLVIGLAFMWTELSALLIYEADGERLKTQAELHDLAWAALQAVMAGLLGAYVATPMARLASPKRGPRKKRGGPRLWLQGGCLSAAAILSFSPTIADSIDKMAFLACMGVSFPLLSAMRYLGCHYTGIGPSATKRQISFVLSPSPPASPPLASSKNEATDAPKAALPGSNTALSFGAGLCSAALYCIVLTTHLMDLIALSHAVYVAVAIQSLIDFEVEHRRGDVSKNETLWTMLYLAAQMFATVSYLEYTSVFASPVYVVAPNMLLLCCALTVGFAMDVLSRRTRRTEQDTGEKLESKEGKVIQKKGNQGKIAAVVTTAFMVLLLILANYFGMMPTAVTSVEEARKIMATPGPGWGVWDAAWSWQFVVSTLGVALLPVAVVQMVG